MVENGIFYRIATGFPRPDDDYRTAREKGRQLRRPLSPDLQVAYDHGVSAFDTAEAAIAQAVLARGRLGVMIVRYDILRGIGIRWEQTSINPNHFTLYGDSAELPRCLAPIQPIRVVIPGGQR